MTLLNPWALAGLALLLVPILVHLFARRRTRVLPFPTLRFIAASRLLPVRTVRLSDPLLLALRCAILAAAAFALAQPRFSTPARQRAAADVLARVIIVDTSASMRGASGSETPLDAARREAAGVADEADVSVTVESAEPAGQLLGAAEWLRYQPGAREIVLLSDFQLGTVDSAALTAVPEGIGLGFVRVPPAEANLAPAERIGDAEIVARAAIADDTTAATWSIAEARTAAHAAVLALASDADSAAARATLDAVSALAAQPHDTTRASAIVFPGYAARTALERAARPPDSVWMADVAAAVWDAPIAHAGVAEVNGRERLLLFTEAAAGTVASAELGLAAANALAHRLPPGEREPAVLPDAQLETWRRAPGPVTVPQDETGGFDGRWFWLLALALLALETRVRRVRREETAPASTAAHGEERHARVA